MRQKLFRTLFCLLATLFVYSQTQGQEQMEVVGTAPKGEHVALIQNTDPDGSGLKIRIDGNHSMWIPFNQNGVDTGAFAPRIPVPLSLSERAAPFIEYLKSAVENRDSFMLPSMETLLAGVFDPTGFFTGEDGEVQRARQIIEDMSLDTLIYSASCRMINASIGLYNNIIDGLDIDIPIDPFSLDIPAFSFRLPDLSLPNINIPTAFPNIPSIPSVGGITNWTPENLEIDLPAINFTVPIPSFDNGINVPDPSVAIPFSIIPGFSDVTLAISIPNFFDAINVPDPSVSINPPALTIPASDLDAITDINLIRSSFSTFNSAISTVNSGIGTINSNLESLADNFRNTYSQLQTLDFRNITINPAPFSFDLPDININTPPLPFPELLEIGSIGEFDCEDALTFNEILFKLPIPDIDELLDLSLGSDNEFITFVDQNDNALGAIKAQHPLELLGDEINASFALTLMGHIVGLVEDDGGAIESGFLIADILVDWIEKYNSVGVTYESGFGDYAEWLPRLDEKEDISFGDVIAVKGGYITKDLTGAEQIMVVSKAPIIKGNNPDPLEEHKGNNIAFMGQVPVKIMGPVASGDFIIPHPELEGMGIAVHPSMMTANQYAQTVGRSWVDNPLDGFKYVNTIVGVHENAWAQPMQKMQEEIQFLQAKLKSTTTALEDINDRLAQLENTQSTVYAKKH